MRSHTAAKYGITPWLSLCFSANSFGYCRCSFDSLISFLVSTHSFSSSSCLARKLFLFVVLFRGILCSTTARNYFLYVFCHKCIYKHNFCYSFLINANLYLSIYLNVNQLIFLSIYPSLYLCIYLSIYIIYEHLCIYVQMDIHIYRSNNLSI